MTIKRQFFIPLFISLILFIIPFFWLSNGEVDLGGDSSRLYFFDPFSYMFSSTLYSIGASSIGAENSYFFGIPFVTLLVILRFFLSPTILSSAFHGLNLSLEFIFVFLIIRQFTNFKKNSNSSVLASAIGGLTYVLSPALIDGWSYVLLTHNQVFLNPLIFYFLLKYFTTSKIKYIFVIVLITFIFSPNFSIIAAPALLAFFPISIVFLFFYTRFVLKKGVNILHLIIGLALFFGVQLFHILPQMTSIFSSSSLNTTIFSSEGKFVRGLSYFSAIAPHVKPSINFFMLPQMRILNHAGVVFMTFPFAIILGFILNSKRDENTRRLYLITSVVFFILFFFATANITNIGLTIYKSFFNLPGFSVFRNYYGQWQNAYIFFYSVFFGQALYIIFQKLSRNKSALIASFLSFVLILNAIPFISGQIDRIILWQSKGIPAVIKMDPEYVKLLSFIRSLPIDGKVLTLPMTDPSYQVIAGQNRGAYVGPSTIAYLAGKKDFAGIEELDLFKDILLSAIKKKDFVTVKNIFSLLNIKYIFMNSDGRIYNESFPGFPYNAARTVLPKSQKEYQDSLFSDPKFVNELGLKKIYHVNTYSVYEITRSYLPHIYTPTHITETTFQVSDWPYLLSSMDSEDQRNAFKIVQENSDYIKLKKVEAFGNVVKEYPIRVVYPFVRWMPGDLIYPFIIWRENKQLQKFRTSDEGYIDRLLHIASKRISEIEKFSNQLKLDIDNKITTYEEPKVWQASKYDSWNMQLGRYIQRIEETIDFVKNSKKNEIWKNIQYIKILENIKSHKIKLNIVINNSSKIQNKKDLFKIIDSIFDTLNHQIKVTEYDPTKSIYEVPDTLKDGTYDINIRQSEDEITNFTIQGSSLEKGSYAKNDWLTYPDIMFNHTNNIVVVSNNFKDIIKNQGWRKVNTQNITVEGESNDTGTLVTENKHVGFIKHLPQMKYRKSYVISFDYNTHGTDFEFSVFAKGDDPKAVYTATFREPKNTREWTKFNALIESPGASDALFSFNPIDKRSQRQEMSVRNFSLFRIPEQEDIILKRSNINSETIPTPQIEFERINPTKYVIKIHNAQKPYTLVMLDAYNSNWKLIDPTILKGGFSGRTALNLGQIGNAIGNYFPLSQKSSGTKMSYFNGGIVENSSKNIFLNSNTFDSWGKEEIPEEKHVLVNGYSNGWYIEPKDINERQDYQLFLEFKTQKVFYGAFFLSIMSVLLTLILLIKSIINEKHI